MTSPAVTAWDRHEAIGSPLSFGPSSAPVTATTVSTLTTQNLLGCYRVYGRFAARSQGADVIPRRIAAPMSTSAAAQNGG